MVPERPRPAHGLGTVSDPFNHIGPRQVSFMVEVARSAIFPLKLQFMILGNEHQMQGRDTVQQILS